MYTNVFPPFLRSLMVCLCLGAFPFQSTAQFPSCNSVCDYLAVWYTYGICTSPSAPSTCVCDNYKLVHCTGIAAGYAAQSGLVPTPEAMNINYEQIVYHPISLAIDPLTTDAGGSVRLVEKGLYLATKGISQSNAAQITWKLQLVNPSNPKEGHYIIASGQQEGYLHWIPGQDLRLVSDIHQLSPTEQNGLRWMLGSGAFEDHVATAYRIVSMLDFSKGIALDKGVGQLSVVPLFQASNNMTSEELGGTPMILDSNYHSLWKIGSPTDHIEPEVLLCD